MRLNHFTDLGLRTLIYLTQPAAIKRFTIRTAAEELNVSVHHLVKVVNFMANQGWIISLRGRNGGIMLAGPPESYRIGSLIRILEERDAARKNVLIDCLSLECPLQNQCFIKNILTEALDVFTGYLNRFSLRDVIHDPVSFGKLIKGHVPDKN